jgi:hypothetical protein
MAIFNGAFPLLPGKLEAARSYAKETMGPRRPGFDEWQKRGKTTRETWSLQENPDGGAVLIVMFESPDPQQSFAEHAQDSSDFAVWFRERIKEISGADLTQALEGGPELILEWSA